MWRVWQNLLFIREGPWGTRMLEGKWQPGIQGAHQGQGARMIELMSALSLVGASHGPVHQEPACLETDLSIWGPLGLWSSPSSPLFCVVVKYA